MKKGVVYKTYGAIKSIFPSLHIGVTWRAFKKRMQVRLRNRRVLRGLRKRKDAYRVLFLATDASRWKLESLCKQMADNPNFEPMILVCPIVNSERDYMLKKMDECYKSFQTGTYNCMVVRAYDDNNDTFINANDFRPDIVFFTLPYVEMSDERYYIGAFPNSLLCYANYFYVDTNEGWFYQRGFHELVYRYYIENAILKKIIKQYAPCYPYNCRVSGYPLFDTFRAKEGENTKEDGLKKIVIWAPHHSIGDDITSKQSTFLMYAEYMRQLAKAYKDNLIFVFKPHPELQNELYKHPDWGKGKTDDYYAWWANGENTSYVTGGYVDLFLSSSAMIHDCRSFLIEFQYTRKPVMFLNTTNHESKLNEVAKEARKCHYIGESKEDIKFFIEEVVLKGNDSLIGTREAFYKNYILPPNGKLAAENIIEDLLTSLGRK